jgi:hypothetical protein
MRSLFTSIALHLAFDSFTLRSRIAIRCRFKCISLLLEKMQLRATKTTPVALFIATSLGICTMSDAAQFFVAINGNDANAGTLAAPFLTVSHCAEIATAGDTCTIRAGVYRESVRPAASGSATAPITFEAYRREEVTISGADFVSGWTLHSGNIYKTNVSLPVTGHADTGFLANQIFVNGEMMIEARWPNMPSAAPAASDLMKPVYAGGGVSSPTGLDAVVSNADIPDIGESWAGATVWTSEWYTSRTGTITGGSGTSLNATMTAVWERGGFWFYLSNKLGLLDAPREWFYNGTTLYLWAPNDGAPTAVEAKRRNFAFDLSERSHIRIRNLKIFASTITTSDASVGVVIDNVNAKYVSHHATLPRPPISEWSGNDPSDGDLWLSSHAHDTGIQLRGTGHTLKNSRIAWSSGNGVLLKGTAHTVTNNFIDNTNYMVSYAAAIRINGDTHRITHNSVSRTGRDALIVDWHTTPYIFKDSEIAYNDISYFGMLSTDLGAIYVCCYINMAGTTIHHNHIRDGYGFSPFWGTRAIYFDIESFNSTVHHNVTWNLDYAADNASFLGSTNRGYHRIYNNTFLTNMFVDAGLEAKNNIFREETSLTTANASNNLFKAVDPKFVDATNGDFTLQADSPAIDQGVVIAGVTGAISGAAPDIGAYERGGPRWKAGAVAIDAPLGTCPFDVDRSGTVAAANDGVMLLRYVLGFTDSAITASVSDTAASPLAVTDAIERDRAVLDMDGDGVLDSNDALIVVRHLLGISGAPMVAGLRIRAPRDTAAKVDAYLSSGCPRNTN